MERESDRASTWIYRQDTSTATLQQAAIDPEPREKQADGGNRSMDRPLRHTERLGADYNDRDGAHPGKQIRATPISIQLTTGEPAISRLYVATAQYRTCSEK